MTESGGSKIHRRSRFKKLRKEAGVTQSEVADHIGRSPSSISYYENGHLGLPEELWEKAVEYMETRRDEEPTSRAESEPDEGDEDDEPLPDGVNEPDGLFDVFSSPRRRLALLLIDRLGETDLGTISTLMPAVDDGCHPEEVGSRRRKAAYVGMYQTHAWRLRAAGLIEWDKRSGRLAPTAETAETAEYLRTILEWDGSDVNEEVERVLDQWDGFSDDEDPSLLERIVPGWS